MAIILNLCQPSFVACLLLVLVLMVKITNGMIYCYSCISTHPGCGLDTFRYSWHHSRRCPRPDDRCVKLIEQRGSEVVITRDCLSHLEGHRVDIPPDKYEGCRDSTQDVKLGQFTFNRIKELDTKRNYFSNTTFCFCMFDHRCNSSTVNASAAKLCSILLTMVVIFQRN